MKTAILLVLIFASTAFAHDLDNLVGIFETVNGEVVIIIDTPEPYVAPKPVDTSVDFPKYLKPDVADILNFFWLKSVLD
jgi:hypothetical protein